MKTDSERIREAIEKFKGFWKEEKEVHYPESNQVYSILLDAAENWAKARENPMYDIIIDDGEVAMYEKLGYHEMAEKADKWDAMSVYMTTDAEIEDEWERRKFEENMKEAWDECTSNALALLYEKRNKKTKE
jgi:hypothetical protein